jgi:hypothetical protein
VELNGTVNPVEVAWTVVGLVACTAHCYRLWSAILDHRYQVRRHINGGRSRIIRAQIRRQSISAIVQALFAMIGIFAMSLPPNSGAPANLAAYFTGGCLLLAEGLLMVNSVQDFRDAKELEAWVREHLSPYLFNGRGSEEGGRDATD